MSEALKTVRIVFLGSPTAAVDALSALHAAGAKIVGVVTQPEKPAGRGGAMTSPPVKRWAMERGLPVFQPRGLRRPENRAFLEDLAPDLLVVVAYGKILPKEVLDLPRYGAVNIHFSLLPKYRGPAPVPATILSGDAETGVTIFKLDEGIDTGPVLVRESLPVASGETSQTLGGKLSALGAKLLVPTVERYVSGNLSPTPQDHAAATRCGIITKEDGRIDWTTSAAHIERMTRAYAPWPGAWTEWETAWGTNRLIIHRVSVLPLCDARAAIPGAKRDIRGDLGAPGSVEKLSDGRVVVFCGGDAAIELQELQLQDRPRMDAGAFLRGHADFIGARLGSR